MIIDVNTIYQMDCLEGMKHIPAKSVDLILCDLPYGTTGLPWDSVIPFEQLWKQYKRLIKDNGAIVLTASQPFTTALINSNLSWFRYEWIWKKSNHITGHANANRMPLKNHENVCVFYKKLPTYNPQGLISVKPVLKRRKYSGKTYLGENELTLLKPHVVKFKNYPKSVIDFPRDRKTHHPTQKPVTLFEYIIKTYTNPGETVLDNCMGGFTTAVACDNTQRNWYGFEMDSEFCRKALDRINENRLSLKLPFVELNEDYSNFLRGEAE